MLASSAPSGGSLALGLATLERLLGSEDEKVALKAAELLLRWHPDVQKRKPVTVEVEPPAGPTPDASPPSAPPVPPSEIIRAAKKVFLASFRPPVAHPADNGPPASPTDPSTLTSFLRPPRSAKDESG